MAHVRVCHVVTITTVVHIGIHISLIMPYQYRNRTSVERWETSPIPRRTPRYIHTSSEMNVYARSLDKHRLYYEVVTVYVGRTYQLYISVGNSVILDHHCSHVLIHTGTENRLYGEHVHMPVHVFDNAQIVNITVTVQIEIGKHIRGTVQQLLEFLNIGRLRKSGSNSLQIKTQ